MKIRVFTKNESWEINLKAILSTTVLPLDGIYKITRIYCPKGENILAGVQHYIGHPATKTLVEKLGSVKAESNLFEGLQSGEATLSFAIKQGRSNRKDDGFTNPHQDVSQDDLDVRVIERLR